MSIKLEKIKVTAYYTDYRLVYGMSTFQVRDFNYHSGLMKYTDCYNVTDQRLSEAKLITANFGHYFIDWLHPTEEEFIAFCLEFDLEY